mgnify:CR=1 FL=1
MADGWSIRFRLGVIVELHDHGSWNYLEIAEYLGMTKLQVGCAHRYTLRKDRVKASVRRQRARRRALKMDISELLKICEAYSKLGGAIQEQIIDACNNNFDECNINALEYIKKFLQRVAVGNGSFDEGNQAAEEAAQVVKDIETYLAGADIQEEA